MSGFFGGLDPAAFDPSAPVTTPVGAPPSLADLAEQAELAAQQKALLEGVDQRTGAPLMWRPVVGSKADEDSRLVALRKMQTQAGINADAIPLPGTDNFVFTDPRTKKKTLYNPPGVDWGDFASLGAEAGGAAGGFGGAAAGTFAGGPIGGYVGGGAGYEAGLEGTRKLISLLSGTGDERTAGQVATDVGVGTALGIAGGPVGESVLGPIIRWGANLFRAGPTATTIAADALKARNVAPDLSSQLPAGVAAESRGLQRAESAAMQTFGGAGPIENLYEGSRQSIAGGIDTTASRAAGGAPVPNPETFASDVNGIANNITSRWQTSRQALDDNAMNLIGPDRPVSVAPIERMRNFMIASRAEAPNTLGPRYDAAIDQLNRIIADSDSGGNVPFRIVRQARTDLGKSIDWLSRGVDAPIGETNLQDVYHGLNGALRDAAQNAGQPAANALAAHDAAVTAWNAEGGPAETMKALSNTAMSSNVLLNLAKSTAPQAQLNLNQMLNAASPAQRGTLVSGIIGQLGLKDGELNMTKFAKDWANITDQAKGMMFSGSNAPLQGDLDNLATVANSWQKAGFTRGHSNTAAVLHLLGTLGSAGSALLAGSPELAAGALATGFGPPLVVSRMMTSRGFVNWLTTTMSDQSAGAWGKAIGRLGAVADEDPSVRDYVSQLQMKMAHSKEPGASQ